MEKKFVYYQDQEVKFIVKAKTPLKAAKKIWKKYKFDHKFYIYTKDLNEEFLFDPNEWSSKGKFLK